MTLNDGFPPFYAERLSSAHLSTDVLYLIYSICMMVIALILVLPGFPGVERLFFSARWSLNLFVGGSIVACVLGSSWHVGTATAMIPFQADDVRVLNATIGLQIGLSHFNVTLKGVSAEAADVSFTEEYYFLTTDQQMETALQRGLPAPILNVVEHFTGNKVSSIWPWSRRYWLVGHYATYMLWAAFGTWILSTILLQAVLKYSALLTFATGFFMMCANLSFLSITPYGQPEVYISYLSEVVGLTLAFGWCFWLCLAVGVLSMVCGVIVIYADKYHPKNTRHFFNIEEDDKHPMHVVTAEEIQEEKRRRSAVSNGSIGYRCYDNDVFIPPPPLLEAPEELHHHDDDHDAEKSEKRHEIAPATSPPPGNGPREVAANSIELTRM